MDLLSHLATGFSVALSLTNLGYCFVGVLLGTLVGVLPGIGPIATIAMLMPLTYTLSPTASLIMLCGIYYGSQYGGSTTAILVNLPGDGSSAVTTIDGFQMAKRGRAGPALAAAAIGSFFAGSVATLLIALFAVPLTAVALEFGPAEYFSLMVLGLLCSITLASGSLPKALSMVVLGLLLGLVGRDVFTGAARFTFNFPELSDGVNFVALAIGLFGIGEIIRNLEDESDRRAVVQKVTGLFPTREDLKRIVWPIIRGTGIGSCLGILPGGGDLLSSFAAYTVEKRVSKNSAEFGKGAIEGVAAPESANNAGAQISFIPVLTLGIPGSPALALIIGVMMIHGIVPGPNVVSRQPELFWGIIASMWIGNFMLILLNLPLIGIWVRLLRVPYYALFPAIMAFSVIGVFSINGSSFDLIQITIFGLAGYLLVRLGCEPAPMLLGFILGPMLEVNLRRALIISHGDATTFLTRPISATLLAIAVGILALALVPEISRSRAKVFVED